SPSRAGSRNWSSQGRRRTPWPRHFPEGRRLTMSTAYQLEAALSENDADLPFESAVIISPFFWNFRDDMWQTTHNVALQFARRFPTILVEPPAPWNGTSEQFRVGRLANSLCGRRVREAAPNLLVFGRRSLPAGRFDVVRRLDHRRNIQALRALQA